ncbi:Hypothetical protein ETEE_3614 [Edwardsiella anguillarum ET080813]|uniref:Uncharacterized protein n=1 Tax=Edwardsiella anguillarum ET080813 TaxID=667120 RepID=A0A076LX93_9GAMM|nr:Hypothetical protein ETEE_3614 [Edwardsiella anguillarum ET080813]
MLIYTSITARYNNIRAKALAIYLCWSRSGIADNLFNGCRL